MLATETLDRIIERLEDQTRPGKTLPIDFDTVRTLTDLNASALAVLRAVHSQGYLPPDAPRLSNGTTTQVSLSERIRLAEEYRNLGQLFDGIGEGHRAEDCFVKAKDLLDRTARSLR